MVHAATTLKIAGCNTGRFRACCIDRDRDTAHWARDRAAGDDDICLVPATAADEAGERALQAMSEYLH
jgi:hypothetical protein